jgi:hypothetical protein
MAVVLLLLRWLLVLLLLLVELERKAAAAAGRRRRAAAAAAAAFGAAAEAAVLRGARTALALFCCGGFRGVGVCGMCVIGSSKASRRKGETNRSCSLSLPLTSDDCRPNSSSRRARMVTTQLMATLRERAPAAAAHRGARMCAQGGGRIIVLDDGERAAFARAS